MNEVFLELENYLAAYPEIESFVTSIHNIDNGRLEITFVPEEENGAFPHLLKNELIRQANQIGSADFDIWGVGQGFSNNTQEGWFNNHIELRGYNYDLIMAEATMFKDTLLKHKRIEEVIIQTGNSWRGKPRYAFVMGLDAEKLEEVNGSLQDVYRELLFQSPREIRAAEVAGEEGVIPVFLREASSGQTTIWDMHNNMLTASGKAFRLKDVGFINAGAHRKSYP
ncbi:acriflavin resistance protein [Geofilum rubicundum JCM 15548]|uniref:Acriflavin resistance protein n=2 Tax=Geofilum TaxID=1236988 RepID=A0A0E9LSX1_9BACT|nr:acriflavin resistance protein [Geofilum rubicundum JCM 15548]